MSSKKLPKMTSRGNRGHSVTRTRSDSPPTALSAINELEGVRAKVIGDEVIHVNFNIQYKRKMYCEYFAKLERLPNNTWRVFSHSLPHYLPMEAILRNDFYAHPETAVKEIYQFLVALAARKGQVTEARAKYSTILNITNTATYDLVRLFFKRETDVDLWRGITLDLKYTLLAKLPTTVIFTIPARTRTGLTEEDHEDLQTVKEGFERSSIIKVIKAIIEE